ncbi:hypothetical protein, partial [Bradyrhizobium sp.]|uniref:hypothetical protein n=1 Tax=Bradyrhizobium sp. TaxID=376 RepID=UPI0025C2F6B7
PQTESRLIAPDPRLQSRIFQGLLHTGKAVDRPAVFLDQRLGASRAREDIVCGLGHGALGSTLANQLK